MSSNNHFGIGLPPSLSSLGQFGTPTNIILPEVKGLWYHEQEIYLDGWKFISCRFDNCRFYVNIGNFVIENCFIDEHCTVRYHGAALKVIQLFNRESDFIRREYPNFSAQKNANGTFSLGV